jgi:hypothetical protein
MSTGTGPTNLADSRDMAASMEELLRGQSHAALIGPIADAGGASGLVLRGGDVG